MNLKFCPKCGNEVIEGANFCLNCGTNFQELIKKNNKAESNKTEEIPVETVEAEEEVVDTVKHTASATSNSSSSNTRTAGGSNTGFESIDPALGRAFAEMDKIYFDMVNSSEPMETTIINTMINMRSCNEQLVRFLVNKVGLTDSQVLAGAKAKNSSYNDKNTVDAMSQILALNFYGFIPANIEDTMHDVRMCGNEAAHRSTGPNNKTYNFYNKTPEQIKKYAIEMHNKLDIIKAFVLKNYEEVFLHPASGGTGLSKYRRGNASNSVKIVGIFIIIVIAIAFGIFFMKIFQEMDANQKKQQELAAGYSQAVNNYNNSVNNNNNNVDKTAIRNAAKASASNAASTYQVDYSVKMKNQFKAADMKKTALNEIQKCDLNKANIITVKAGQTTQLTGNTDYFNSQDLICASSNKNVATINWAGVIKGVKKGTCVGVIRNTSIQKYTWFIINVE